ncbi:MAG: 4-alpha-glucanotransferase [Chloroflexota bacterium]|nr:4-alpha-glucanotransferase [Chloroflexota bacterium]
MTFPGRPADAVLPVWTDAFGVERVISASTRDAVRAAMRLSARDRRSRRDPILLARAGQRLAEPGELVLEDGTQLGMVGRLPRDLPFGYHRLITGPGERLVLAAPARCPLPEGYRAWGWAVQLYAARSRASWGIGDLGDLRLLGSWAEKGAAGALLISPTGAPNPGPDPEPSPYFPSTRRFRDPLLLRIEEVPGAHDAAEVSRLAAEGRALNPERLIDRGHVLRLKGAALDAIWHSGARHRPGIAERLEAYEALVGPSLRTWATFVTLTEELAADWRTWPEPLRRPGSSEVARFARVHEDRVAFHMWVQWLLDEQLASAASAGPRLVADLPVGFDPAGFDAWEWQEVLAADTTIGAPPDIFNTVGQDWGLPPFIPHRLREAGLGPFVETVRATLRHAGGLRIDHILGLFRLWWVPAGVGPADGAYVRYPVDELLAVLAIEATRAAALVIGEDLGTVERGVRRTLAARRVLSTRLALFEHRPPRRYPRHALAAVTTHDLPTIAGAWNGSDLDDLRRAGVRADADQLAGLRAQIARAGRVSADSALPEAVVAVHRALAASPSCLVAATLEDASLVTERPNVPGTDRQQRANWSLALPRPLEELERDPFVAELAAALIRA